MQHSERVFFPKDAEFYAAKSSWQHNGCLETLPFADHTTIHTQHKRGLLPEILEDSLNQNVYIIYVFFFLEIAMSFGR